MAWDKESLTGPNGVDWRVPVSELENRRKLLSEALSKYNIESVLIDDPVELYWLTGGRQNGMILVGSKDSDIETTHWVKRSLERARFESGGDNCPDSVLLQPRMSDLANEIREKGGFELSLIHI